MCILDKDEWDAFERQIQEPISTEKKERLRKSYANGLNMIRDMRTLQLARLVAEMPPLKNDKKSIEEWAERLAEDFCK